MRGTRVASSSAHVTESGAHGTRAERNSNWNSVVPADGTGGAATSERTETSVGPRFMSSYQTYTIQTYRWGYRPQNTMAVEQLNIQHLPAAGPSRQGAAWHNVRLLDDRS